MSCLPLCGHEHLCLNVRKHRLQDCSPELDILWQLQTTCSPMQQADAVSRAFVYAVSAAWKVISLLNSPFSSLSDQQRPFLSKVPLAPPTLY